MKAQLLHVNHIAWCSSQTNVYQLDAPYEGFDHVAISVRVRTSPYDHPMHANYTDIVGCREDGAIEADTVEALNRWPGESLDFGEALHRIGYECDSPGEPVADLGIQEQTFPEPIPEPEPEPEPQPEPEPEPQPTEPEFPDGLDYDPNVVPTY